MLNIKNLVYILTLLSFSVIIGAGIYEHLAVWPRAYADPPASLTMFQGEYGLNSAAFWTKIHPVTMLLFIVTSVLFWKSALRKHVLIAFVGYVVVMISTFTYFVPELIEITSTEYVVSVDDSLQSRGDLWIKLSLVRMVFLVGLAILLGLGLTKVAPIEKGIG